MFNSVEYYIYSVTIKKKFKISRQHRINLIKYQIIESDRQITRINSIIKPKCQSNKPQIEGTASQYITITPYKPMSILHS